MVSRQRSASCLQLENVLHVMEEEKTAFLPQATCTVCQRILGDTKTSRDTNKNPHHQHKAVQWEQCQHWIKSVGAAQSTLEIIQSIATSIDVFASHMGNT